MLLQFSFPKFARIYLTRALLIGLPGLAIWVTSMFRKTPLLAPGTPKSIVTLVVFFFVLAVFATIFITPAIFLGPLGQYRESVISILDDRIIYRFLKSRYMSSETYYIYTIRNIYKLDISRNYIYIYGNIILKKLIDSDEIDDIHVERLKIPNVFKDVEKLKEHCVTD